MMDFQMDSQGQIIKEEIEDAMTRVDIIESHVIKTIHTRKTFGKTIDEWHKELSIPIDPAADPAKIKMYCSQLAFNLSLAYRNLSKAKALYSNYKMSYNTAFNDKVATQASNRSRKVVPSADTMTKVAESQLGDRALVVMRYESAIDFWQSMVFKIKDLIDIVKTMGMSNGTLYKVGEYSTT
jgi:hypothetical protein